MAGNYIDTIHEPAELGGWFGDFELLEQHHGYIQWLFPIRENGMNMRAQELQLHEAVAIRNDPKCRARVVKSYQVRSASHTRALSPRKFCVCDCLIVRLLSVDGASSLFAVDATFLRHATGQQRDWRRKRQRRRFLFFSLCVVFLSVLHVRRLRARRTMPSDIDT
jgi:hypothetical protein